jgi:sec-independent protein translocase protein TatB
MFDLGAGELMVIGVVALIVVGPKDLPVLFRNVGRYVGKARGMAREFSRAMEAAADDAGVKDIDRTLKAAVNPKAVGLDALRDAAGLKTAAAPRTPPVGTPPVGAAAAGAAMAVKPGGETEALIKKRAADQAEAQRKATELAAARALGEAPVAAPAEGPVMAAAVAKDTDGAA